MTNRISLGSAAAGVTLTLAAAITGLAHYRAPLANPIALEDVPTPMVKPDPTTLPRSVAALSMNGDGLRLIMDNEGLRLEPYKFRNAWYIGYGHGRTATADMKITKAEALTLLREDIRHYEADVRRHVKVPLTEGQFSALVSFVYNVGVGTFSKSSILSHLNNGDMDAAADALMLYTKAKVNGEYRELRSLRERRRKERALFLGKPEDPVRTLRT